MIEDDPTPWRKNVLRTLLPWCWEIVASQHDDDNDIDVTYLCLDLLDVLYHQGVSSSTPITEYNSQPGLREQSFRMWSELERHLQLSPDTKHVLYGAMCGAFEFDHVGMIQSILNQITVGGVRSAPGKLTSWIASLPRMIAITPIEHWSDDRTVVQPVDVLLMIKDPTATRMGIWRILQAWQQQLVLDVQNDEPIHVFRTLCNRTGLIVYLCWIRYVLHCSSTKSAAGCLLEEQLEFVLTQFLYEKDGVL